jgi:hypothetical protein
MTDETDENTMQDEEWVQIQVERMSNQTPGCVRELFNAEHEATDKLTFETFWERRYQAERNKWREQENQEVLRLAIEKEVIELFGEIYFAYVGGTRLAKVKRLSDILICPKCSTPIPGHAESSLHECYDARHRSLGDPNETSRLLPFKIDASGSCPKCKESWSATFLVIP